MVQNSTLNADIQHMIRMLPLTVLKEDPLNYEAFSMQEIEALAKDIQKDGFFGEISAYPIEDGFYRIESGHRRYRAAKLAGLAELPVSITAPPSSMIERRLRLTQWNQHTRSFTPMDVAKLVSFTYDTLSMMKKQGKAEGSLLNLTAQELGISTSNISKYKMLLSLHPKLQELAASGQYSWAHLAGASVLSSEGQYQLYLNIVNEEKIHPVTGAWIHTKIDEYKHIRRFLRRSTDNVKDADSAGIRDTELYGQPISEASSTLADGKERTGPLDSLGGKEIDEQTAEDKRYGRPGSVQNVREWLYGTSSSNSNEGYSDDIISQREKSDIEPGIKNPELLHNPQIPAENLSEESTNGKMPNVRHRRCDGAKGIRRAARLLQISLSEEALIKDRDMEEVIMLLREINAMTSEAEKQLRRD